MKTKTNGRKVVEMIEILDEEIQRVGGLEGSANVKGDSESAKNFDLSIRRLQKARIAIANLELQDLKN